MKCSSSRRAGDVKELAKGSTALDFAYAVHTDVGNHTLGVKVSGHMVPLKYVLKSGDIVEVITQSNRAPSRDWLKIVTTSRAKNKIRHWFRTHLTSEEVDRGRDLMDQGSPPHGRGLARRHQVGRFDGIRRAVQQPHGGRAIGRHRPRGGVSPPGA
jgi:guanosine-3',5'-bis(diphosphate) 3'-pyrophosphohydrolase